MRYSSAIIRKDSNGKRYYRPSIIPHIPIKNSDIFIRPKYGERFDMLAQKYYNDSNLWWIIVKANNIGKGQMVADTEKKIRIPIEIGDIVEAVHKSNS